MNIYSYMCLRIFAYFISVLFLSIGNSLYAQSQSFGFHLGVTSYTGDLNPGTLIVDYSKPTGGLFYRYGFGDAVALRMNLQGGSIAGSDKDASDVLGQFRNLEFDITYAEVSVVLEYYFLNPRNLRGKKVASPYVFVGTGVMTFSSYKDPATDYSTIQPVVPFGLGFKIPVGRVGYLDLNLGMRKMFFDYLDNISIESTSEKNFLYGDQYSSDWYHYFNISFSYSIQSIICPIPPPKKDRYNY